MDHNEKKLSDFIDRLNVEQQPDEDEYSTESEDLAKLYQTVKKVRSLKEPAMPAADFKKQLVKKIKMASAKQAPRNYKKWAWVTSVVSFAAILALIMNFLLPFDHENIVHAMEAAYSDVKAYHGTLEIVETNAKGESTTQAVLEVWANKEGNYYIKGTKGANKNLITVNNGEKKWQLHPDQKQVQLFPAFPDAYRFVFEIGNEINDVKNALSTKVVGDDTVAGRKATIVEVTPKGGEAYRIWIDQKTKLPLQKQTAMQKSIQYKITYSSIDFSEKIPNDLLAYQVPAGYTVIDTNPELAVNDLSEAAKAAGFTPETPTKIPAGFALGKIAVIPDQKTIKLYYGGKGKEVIIVEGKAAGSFTPAPTAQLGKMNGSPAEIQSPISEDSGVLGGGAVYAGMADVSSIRWQESGYEYAVVGNTSLEELVAFSKALTNGSFEMPALDAGAKPQVAVPYDVAVEENDQKSVDAGSSPWRLDPVFSTQVFVSLQLSPQGITGDYPIDLSDLKVVQNDGKTALVEVNNDQTPIKKVYLKRLVRQDATGIWTVVGYDK